jgi:hypothetical protein
VTWIALWKCQEFNFSKVHLHVRFNIAFLNWCLGFFKCVAPCFRRRCNFKSQGKHIDIKIGRENAP